ncbi:MAG: hypothetical protein MR029_05925 [Clostridium sp.]|nr:hypothetical protein [Clostridium sp.]
MEVSEIDSVVICSSVVAGGTEEQAERESKENVKNNNIFRVYRPSLNVI